MDNKTTSTETSPFAIVPQALIAHRGIEPTTKIILIYCLSKHQIRLENGQPWTFSCSSIEKGTGLNERTVRRHVSIIKDRGVLKQCGHGYNGKRKYPIYRFDRRPFDTWVGETPSQRIIYSETASNSATDNLTVDNTNESNDFVESIEVTTDSSTDSSTELKPTSNKILKERAVAVPVQGQPETLNGEDCDNKSSVGSNSAEGSLMTFDEFFNEVSSSVDSNSAVGGIEDSKTITKTIDLSSHLPSNVAVGDMRGDKDNNGIGVAPKPSSLATGDIEDNRGQPLGAVAVQSQYVVSQKWSMDLPIPYNIPSNHCAKRQDWIVKALNKDKGGKPFIKDEPTHSRLDGFYCCAYSREDKEILITCESLEHTKTAHVQKVCSHFKPLGWRIYVWTERDSKVFKMISETSK